MIGRGNEADLRIDDPGVSRKHIEIGSRRPRTTGPRGHGDDLGSTNGVLVDGKRVEQAALVDGATIRIGNTTCPCASSTAPDPSKATCLN